MKIRKSKLKKTNRSGRPDVDGGMVPSSQGARVWLFAAQAVERAYWVANIMSSHLKKPVKPAALMKPFEKKKTKQEIMEEREAFFNNFEHEREEVEKCQRKK